MINACKKTSGRTDAFADNYDPKANEGNGTCAYSGTLIFRCSMDRKLELETNGYVSPASIFINGEFDYASHHSYRTIIEWSTVIFSYLKLRKT